MFEPFVFLGVLGGRVVAAVVSCGLEVVVTAAGTRACTANKWIIFRRRQNTNARLREKKVRGVRCFLQMWTTFRAPTIHKIGLGWGECVREEKARGEGDRKAERRADRQADGQTGREKPHV